MNVGILFGRRNRYYRLSQSLKRRGIEVTIYHNNGIQGAYTKIPYSLFRTLWFVLRNAGHDIYNTNGFFIPAIVLCVNKVIRKIPYVVTINGLLTEEFAGRAGSGILGWLKRKIIYPFLYYIILNFADFIICNSHYLQRKIAEVYPQCKHKVLGIHNGIEFSKYSSGHRKDIPGVQERDIVLFAMTTLNNRGKASGVHLLVDSMYYILQRYPDVKLVIAAKVTGAGFLNEIQKYISTKAWSESIIWFVNRTDIPDLLASSDIFVFSTPRITNDSLPRALLEAQSAALPVVTTNTSGCSEAVQDNQTGCVVDYNPEQFANKVWELIENPDLRKEFGKNGRAWIQEHFTWDKMADGYINVFQKVLESKFNRF